MLIAVLFVFQTTQAETKDQRIKVTLRTICDEFLWQLGDSTSRILPIEHVDGKYIVRFEKNFSFEPDLLLFSVFKIYMENNVKEDFIVEVEDCWTKEIMHSFKASDTKKKSLGPCRMRELPKSCFVFYFTEIEEEVTVAVDTVKKNVTPHLNPDINSKIKSKASSTDRYINGVLLFLVVSASGFFYFKRKQHQNKDLSNVSQEDAFICIGQYKFDQKAMTLTLENNSVELSTKETDLLALLYAHENETLEREYILNQVWKDEGNYIGRTLDVYISKLRKKLEEDTNIKIVNVRGVGYRFVVVNH